MINIYYPQADQAEEDLGFKDLTFSGPFFIVYISGIIVAFLLIVAISVQTFYILKKGKSNGTPARRGNNTLTEVSQPYQLEQVHMSSFGAGPKTADLVKVQIILRLIQY
jgi:hypothetical protein